MREQSAVTFRRRSHAHRLIEPGQPAYESVVQEFGRGVLDEQGRVVRPDWPEIVFGDPARLARLNAIVHPHVLSNLDVELGWLAQGDVQGVAWSRLPCLSSRSIITDWIASSCLVHWGTAARAPHFRARHDGGTGLPAHRSADDLEEKRKLADDEIDCSGHADDTRRQSRPWWSG